MKIFRPFRLFALPPQSNPIFETAPSQPAKRRFGKKLYAVIAVVVVAIIAVAFFIPQGAATIPLSVDYVVDEKMVYDTSVNLSLNMDSPLSSELQTSNSTNASGQQTIDVIGFDGENYLLNHTITMDIYGEPASVSMTEKMNKTGYSTYLFDFGSIQQEVTSGSPVGGTVLAQLLSTPEAKVGETITVPFPGSGSQNVQTTGELTIKFGGIEDLTVPAGTYKAFRIDITSSNLQMTLNPEDAGTFALGDLSMNMDLNYQVYLEYGSLRQIKSSMQISGSFQSSILNMAVEMGMDMTLRQHIKP